MRLETIIFATAMTAISSVAFAQAPIGSSADFGNGAVINRGPVQTTGEDMDFRRSRAYMPRGQHRTARHHHRHVAERMR
jgi:hypothetical protein